MGDIHESFEEIKNKTIEIVKTKFQPNQKMDIVSSVTKLHLGEGATIGGATADQVDGLDAIYETLVEKANELGL